MDKLILKDALKGQVTSRQASGEDTIIQDDGLLVLFINTSSPVLDGCVGNGFVFRGWMQGVRTGR